MLANRIKQMRLCGYELSDIYGEIDDIILELPEEEFEKQFTLKKGVAEVEVIPCQQLVLHTPP